MRLIDADAFDKMLVDAQAECKSNGGNFRFGVLSNVRENLRMMPTVEQERRWIPVSERLPDGEYDVLLIGDGKGYAIAYYSGGTWYDYHHNHLKGFTHWMPLPQPPKEGEME